jgi:DNA polymerase III epsilon subunit family exonuclease
MNGIEEAVFCIVDLETHALAEGVPSRICEIGAIKTREGKELERFHSLVNPREPISEDAARIHGITDKMVRQAPPFGQVAPSFLEFSRGTVFVAHNTAFDLVVLNDELKRAGLAPWQGAAVDTVRLARKAFSGLPSYGLDGLASFFEVSFRERHRSIGDCEMTLHVFWKCVERLRQLEKVRTLTDLLEAGRNWRAERAR